MNTIIHNLQHLHGWNCFLPTYDAHLGQICSLSWHLLMHKGTNPPMKVKKHQKKQHK